MDAIMISPLELPLCNGRALDTMQPTTTSAPATANGATPLHTANDPYGLVSVVIPIYNAEPYLELALLTIENQTHKNLEIICLNDGSTDDSLATVLRHAAADDRYVVIDKPNEGYGATCNRGITLAQGTWVAIVEPDDWLDLAMYHDMLQFAATFEEPLDIVKTPYWRVWMPDTPSERIYQCSYKGLITPPRQPFTAPDAPELLRHHPSIWSALYRREFLEEYGIRFPELPGAGWADNPFLVETLVRARRIAYLDRAYYYYREETPAEQDAFAQAHTFLPVERWHDMQDVLEAMGCTDPAVLQAQNRKGFVYLNGVLNARPLEDPEVQEAARGMFERMDDALVLADPAIPPHSLRVYAELKGLPTPPNTTGRYLAYLAGKGLYYLKLNGLPYTVVSGLRHLFKNRLA